MRYLQLLYLVAATMAPVGASPAEHAQATAVLYRSLEARITTGRLADVVDYLERVDPSWAPSARRHYETGRPKKVLQRLSDARQRYVRLSGEAAWYRAHARAVALARQTV